MIISNSHLMSSLCFVANTSSICKELMKLYNLNSDTTLYFTDNYKITEINPLSLERLDNLFVR